MLVGSGIGGFGPFDAKPVHGEPPQSVPATKMCAAATFPRLFGASTEEAEAQLHVGHDTLKVTDDTALVNPSLLSSVKLKFPKPSAAPAVPPEKPVPPAGHPPPVQPPV